MNRNETINAIKILFNDIQRRRKVDTCNYGRIAVAKFDGLGDFVLFLDMASHFHNMYPNKCITLITTPNNEYIAKQSGYFDEITIFDNQSLTEEQILSTYDKRIADRKFDLLLNPTSSRHFYAELLCALIYAKIKIAMRYECADEPTAFHDQLLQIYDREIEIGQENMMLIQNANFVRGLGFSKVRADIPTLNFTFKMPRTITDDYCVVFIGGSFRAKRWGIERFGSVMQHIISTYKIKCVICGIEEDCIDARRLKKMCPSAIDLVGETDLDELYSLISRSKFLVGNDTSAAHFAVALGVRAYVICGQFAANRFFPYKIEVKRDFKMPVAIKFESPCAGCSFDYRKKFRCMENKEKVILDCIEGIDVDAVIAAIDHDMNEVRHE